MSGTVNISRGIWKDTAFKPEPFTEREAFMWLVMEASYKARDKPVGNIWVKTERGQVAVSIRFMCEAWDWSKSRVDRFLKRLEKRDMIGTESGTGVSVITICKYDEYQNTPNYSGTAVSEKRDSSGTAAGQQRDKPNKGLIPDVIPDAISRKEEPIGSSKKPDQPSLPDVLTPSPAKQSKRGTRLSEDWKLPRDWGEWAVSEGWHASAVREEAERFRDYWIGKAGASATKVDWQATWRNWMRNCKTPKMEAINGNGDHAQQHSRSFGARGNVHQGQADGFTVAILRRQDGT